jgi:hypothetical protein
MAYIPFELDQIINCNDSLKVLIFTEGTIIGPARLRDWFNHKKYIPLNNSVAKIKTWANQGAEIYYLTSRRNLKEVNQIKNILVNHGLPGKGLYYRAKKEKYKDIAELLIPGIIIEDDCKSIGGKWQMTITYVREDIKNRIKSIVVKEFEGIEHLPNDIQELFEV